MPNPVITFQLQFPNTLVNHQLSPDRYQSNQDVAQAAAQFRPALISSWFPGLLDGNDVEHLNAYTFTLHGQKAHYFLKTYCIAQQHPHSQFVGQYSSPPVVTVVGWSYTDGSFEPVGTTMPIYNGQYQVGSVTIQNPIPVVPA